MHQKNLLSLQASDLRLLQDYIRRKNKKMTSLGIVLENHMGRFQNSLERIGGRQPSRQNTREPRRENSLLSGGALLDRFLGSSESVASSMVNQSVGRMVGRAPAHSAASQGQVMAELASAITRALTRNL